MKKTILLFITLCSFVSQGQSFHDRFKILMQLGSDAKSMDNLFKEWKQKEPSNPELYIGGFNFYYQEATKEVLSLSPNSTNNPQYEVKDSVNKPVAYLGGQKTQNDSLFNVSQNFLVEGIKKNPKRLDMRFGKIYALGTFNRFNDFTRELLETLEYSKKINHKWLWSNNEPVKDEVNFLKAAVQDYQNTLYKNNEDGNMLQIAEKMNTIFPNDAIILCTLGSAYLMDNKLEKALPIFEKAYVLKSDDTIIINNLALSYYNSKDYKNAKRYFTILLEKGDEKQKELAKEKLKQME